MVIVAFIILPKIPNTWVRRKKENHANIYFVNFIYLNKPLHAFS